MSGDIVAEQAQRIAELEAAKIELLRENRSARVQVPLWKGVASAMVERAKRIRCQFGGDHSMADCRCDPHQLGDTVFTMQDELDRAVLTTDFEAKKRIAELEAALAERTKERDAERAVRETAEKEAHQHAERQAELYQERDALEEENDTLKAKLCVVVAEIDATRHERDALAQKVRDLSDPS